MLLSAFCALLVLFYSWQAWWCCCLFGRVFTFSDKDPCCRDFTSSSKGVPKDFLAGVYWMFVAFIICALSNAVMAYLYRLIWKQNHWLLWVTKLPNTIQGSVLTRLSCGGIFISHFIQGSHGSWKVLQSPEKWRKKNQALQSPEIGHWSWKSPEEVLVFDHNGAEKSVRSARQLHCCS